ncbi:MAG TPA: DUF362 domain-containing protein [Bryobacteraceae bacterium]|jgi:uncharacterized protein (DUF362 family)
MSDPMQDPQSKPEPPPAKFDRRSFLTIAGAAAVAGWATVKFPKPGVPFHRSALAPRSSVAIVKASNYNTELAQRILEGVRLCGLDVKDKKVLLKPNLVEWDHATCINTDVAVVSAALEVFHQLGAAEVRIGEGPGHRRDTYDLAQQARYRSEVGKFDSLFVDLNRDDVSKIKNFADEPEFYFPNSALGADVIVSLAKMKTHHWAGATLSMKNFFGLVPGSVYGWPKNTLHHIGIDRSIVELSRVFRKTFAIVDGIVGMEGNGPIQGTPKQAGVLVMGRDLRAVDATCCRIMGIEPAKLEYLATSNGLGNFYEADIQQRGESIASVRTNFKLLEKFAEIRLG